MSRSWWSKVVSAAIALGLVPAAIGATCESLGSLEIPYAAMKAQGKEASVVIQTTASK